MKEAQKELIMALNDALKEINRKSKGEIFHG